MPLKCFLIKFNFYHMWPSPSPSILFYDSIVLKSDKNSINKLIFNAPVENFQLSIWTQWVQCRVTEAIRLRSVSTSLLGGKFQSLTNLIRVEREKKVLFTLAERKGSKKFQWLEQEVKLSMGAMRRALDIDCRPIQDFYLWTSRRRLWIY